MSSQSLLSMGKGKTDILSFNLSDKKKKKCRDHRELDLVSSRNIAIELTFCFPPASTKGGDTGWEHSLCGQNEMQRILLCNCYF